MSKRTVMFVCTGNLCRSPMAEYMLRERLGWYTGWVVSSAGTHASSGLPATRFAVQALKESGITLGPHLSRPVNGELVDDASLIVVMTAGHRDWLMAAYPRAKEKIFLLKSFDPQGSGDIVDPIGSTEGTYRSVRDEIENALPGLVSFMENLE